jgi:uncharacterized membrane protein YagU involved in acid resistance
MKPWYSIIAGGVAGTMVMTVFLLLPRWAGLAKVDVIRAGGALVVGMNKHAYPVGLGIHLALGLVFAFVYALFLALSNLPFNAWSGLWLGALHGVLAMLVVSILIMEHHPEARYHDRGPATGLAQLIGHMLYGITLGAVVTLMG